MTKITFNISTNESEPILQGNMLGEVWRTRLNLDTLENIPNTTFYFNFYRQGFISIPNTAFFYGLLSKSFCKCETLEQFVNKYRIIDLETNTFFEQVVKQLKIRYPEMKKQPTSVIVGEVVHISDVGVTMHWTPTFKKLKVGDKLFAQI